MIESPEIPIVRCSGVNLVNQEFRLQFLHTNGYIDVNTQPNVCLWFSNTYRLVNSYA